MEKKNGKKNQLNRRDFLEVTAAGALSATSVATARPHHARKEAMPETSKDIEFLADYSTTILESAIYLLTGRHEGITFTRPGDNSSIVRRFPKMNRLVGYAVTSTFSTDPDDQRGRRENLDYWNYVFRQPEPKVVVALDASREPGSGSSWGQQNAHVHKALRVRGVITNGGIREIDVYEQLGLNIFSSHLTVGHGNSHLINFGEPITLKGAIFRSGDVVCADEHGAIVIPHGALPHIQEAVAEVNRRVQSVADYCTAANFTPAGLAETIKRTKTATPWRPGK